MTPFVLTCIHCGAGDGIDTRAQAGQPSLSWRSSLGRQRRGGEGLGDLMPTSGSCLSRKSDMAWLMQLVSDGLRKPWRSWFAYMRSRASKPGSSLSPMVAASAFRSAITAKGSVVAGMIEHRRLKSLTLLDCTLE